LSLIISLINISSLGKEMRYRREETKRDGERERQTGREGEGGGEKKRGRKEEGREGTLT
jgi:hypothetical protein